MNILGVHLKLLIGPSPAAMPAPIGMLEALTDIEVHHSDRERSGFRMSFAVGRGGPLHFLDYDLVQNPLLKIHSRVILVAFFNITPRVIMDGIVTRRDLVPGDEPGQGRLVLTGHDVSVAIDRKYNPTSHPAQDEYTIANKIALSYPQFQILPDIRRPPLSLPPLPLDWIPQQTETDWQYLEEIAERFGFVTYVKPGPAPFSNILYWGPPVPLGIQQKALNVNLGPLTNASGVSFTHDGLAGTIVRTKVQDRLTGQETPIIALVPTRPPLGLLPNALSEFPNLREVGMDTSGLDALEAMAMAQGIFDRSNDDTLMVSGSLDSTRYNDVLLARELVDLRGAGVTHDGTYLVRSVTHNIGRGAYTQDFTLSRAELFAKSPVVRAA